MKQNRIEPNRRFSVLVALAAVAVITVSVALLIGYRKLRAVWLEQSVVRDANVQVTVTSGKMVKADVLAENLGLTNGANLATIDFAARREDVLRRIPNLRSVSVTRKLPDKVVVVSEERSPIAQVSFLGRKGATGKVVDSDGMVFICQRGTQMLPVIRETNAPGTAPGHRLVGRARAALHLIEACRDPGFQDLIVLDVDVSKPDYLLVTLGDYSLVKIAWEQMGEASPEERRSLLRQLKLLAQAIRSRVGTGAMIWNATDTATPGRIYADSKGTL